MTSDDVRALVERAEEAGYFRECYEAYIEECYDRKAVGSTYTSRMLNYRLRLRERIDELVDSPFADLVANQLLKRPIFWPGGPRR